MRYLTIEIQRRTVVNLDTRFKLAKDIELFGRVNNLVDREHANFGIL